MMRKMTLEVNDSEVCRKLEILMNSENRLLAAAHSPHRGSPLDFDPREVPEPYTQYVSPLPLYGSPRPPKRALRQQGRAAGPGPHAKHARNRKAPVAPELAQDPPREGSHGQSQIKRMCMSNIKPLLCLILDSWYA